MKTCKQCGQPIVWRRDGDRWKGENPDGTDHWDLCSRARFERVKREGVFFRSAELRRDDQINEVHGYKAPHKTQLVMIQPVESSVGERYKEDGCGCGRPPWELCSETCEHRLKPDRRLESGGGRGPESRRKGKPGRE